MSGTLFLCWLTTILTLQLNYLLYKNLKDKIFVKTKLLIENLKRVVMFIFINYLKSLRLFLYLQARLPAYVHSLVANPERISTSASHLLVQDFPRKKSENLTWSALRKCDYPCWRDVLDKGDQPMKIHVLSLTSSVSSFASETSRRNQKTSMSCRTLF